MDSLWPWLAIAGLGALHGLSPASGWMFAAAWGLREHGGAWRALPPLAIGHAASVVLVALLFARGIALEREPFQWMAGAFLLGTALHCLRRRRAPSVEAGQAGMALWAFFIASAQGAGLMLVPALAPLCLPGSASAGSGTLGLAAAAVALHLAAMLFTTGAVASGLCRACRGLSDRAT